MQPAAFAIPGDIETVTGGYIYERRLLHALRDQGREVAHVALPAGFPHPSPGAMRAATDRLVTLPAGRPVILDGLVSGALDTAGLARVAAPLVFMVHHPLALESGLSEGERAHLYRTERDNLALAAHVVVPSPHTARILQDEYGVAEERISVAPPGFDPAAGAAGRKAAPPLILSVGLLHPRKGHDVLLRALAGIADLDWQARIVGGAHDADHAAALRRLRDGLGLSARVEMPGLLGREALEEAWRAASVFALATWYEGYGMVFGEALTHGLPIVACAGGAVPDTVPGAAGLLVPPGDEGALSEALRRVLEEDGLRGRLARASAAAGAALPGWDGTARVMGRVLDAL